MAFHRVPTLKNHPRALRFASCLCTLFHPRIHYLDSISLGLPLPSNRPPQLPERQVRLLLFPRLFVSDATSLDCVAVGDKEIRILSVQL